MRGATTRLDDVKASMVGDAKTISCSVRSRLAFDLVRQIGNFDYWIGFKHVQHVFTLYLFCSFFPHAFVLIVVFR